MSDVRDASLWTYVLKERINWCEVVIVHCCRDVRLIRSRTRGPLTAADLRFAADTLLAENTAAQHARATALTVLHERRHRALQWGGELAFIASLLAFVWFYVNVTSRLALLQRTDRNSPRACRSSLRHPGATRSG